VVFLSTLYIKKASIIAVQDWFVVCIYCTAIGNLIFRGHKTPGLSYVN